MTTTSSFISVARAPDGTIAAASCTGVLFMPSSLGLGGFGVATEFQVGLWSRRMPARVPTRMLQAERSGCTASSVGQRRSSSERRGRGAEADRNPVIGVHEADRDRQIGKLLLPEGGGRGPICVVRHPGLG